MNWYTLSEFPKYEINKLGQVRNKKSGKILSQSLSTKGYYQINIENKSRRTHRLLCQTFIPNPMNYETVNHINGDKLDNALDNLEWMSRSENVKHSRNELGITPIPYSKSNKKHHLINKTGTKSTAGKSIKAVLENGIKKEYGSAMEAALELFGDSNLGKQIRQSIKRKSKHYKNIKFYESDN